MTATPQIPTIKSSEDAQALCAMLESRLDTLESVIREETDHLATSRLADAFALHERKAMEARSYERSFIAFRHNAVALARYKPTALERIKMRHGSLQSSLEANLKTLQTLTSVSEGILRGVAREVSSARSLSTYGQSGRVDGLKGGAATTPLMVSVRF